MGLKVLALFRHIQGGKPSYYITIAEKMMPQTDKITITLVNPETWKKGRPQYDHIVKKRGKSRIHGSAKLVLNREIVEGLGLGKGSLVWVQISEYTDSPAPPPEKPYIARPVRIHTDKSSLFFAIAMSQIQYLREITPGDNLHVYVDVNGKVIDYIKHPIVIKNEKLYKILLPMNLFSGLVHAHEVVNVKLTTTSKPEELFYTS